MIINFELDTDKLSKLSESGRHNHTPYSFLKMREINHLIGFLIEQQYLKLIIRESDIMEYIPLEERKEDGKLFCNNLKRELTVCKNICKQLDY